MDVLGLNDAAEVRGLFDESRAEACFVEVISGGKTGNSAADDDRGGYGLNSLTKSTTART